MNVLRKTAATIVFLLLVGVPSKAQYSDLNYFETYLQYAPAVLDAGLGLIGVDSKNDFLDRGISIGVSFAVNVVVVKSLKFIVGESRPDGSSDNSFPSGHTATAFMGAELIREHYGWGWGAGAYAAAATVGVMRVVRSRHYWWDVLAGAGLGIAAARTGIWLTGPVRDWIDPYHRMKLASYVEPQTGTLCAALTYTF